MSRTMPSYVEEMIDGAVSRLDNLKNEHTVSFAFMTDTHNCTTLTGRGLYALREIDRRAGVAFTCLGGDYLCNNARTSKEKALSQLRELGDGGQRQSRLQYVRPGGKRGAAGRNVRYSDAPS